MHLKRAINPAHRRPDRRLRLDEHQRKAVDEQDQVRATLCGAHAEGVLLGDDVLVAGEVIEVDEADGRVLVVLAERHRAVTAQPRGELLVGLDEAVAPDREDDGAELVEHLLGAVGALGDLGVEADQRVADEGLDEDVLRLTRHVVRSQIVPAEPADAARATREPGTDGGVVGDAPAEEVAEEGFDGVGLVEGHDTSPLVWIDCIVARASVPRLLRSDAPVSNSSTIAIISRCSSSGGKAIWMAFKRFAGR